MTLHIKSYRAGNIFVGYNQSALLIGYRIVRAGIRASWNTSAEDYRFDGWYRDAACTKEWKFDTDIVQADMTLYAKWLYDAGRQDGFAFPHRLTVFDGGKRFLHFRCFHKLIRRLHRHAGRCILGSARRN